jgi:hypothetical protein
MAMMAAGSGTMFDPDLFARFERLARTSGVFRRAPQRQQVAS